MILLPLFLCLIAVLFAPVVFKPTRESSVPAFLKESERSEVWEDSLVQKIRNEVVLKGLSEMALREEPKPPLPRMSLFPTERLEEQEKMRILEGSRFYHELEEIVQGEERKREFFNVPRPTTRDVKGGGTPLPEDEVAQQIIASLKETTKEEEGAQKNNAEDNALDIRGPAANRKISYIPPPLQSKPIVNGDTTIKFWILPDGTVGKVIPLVTEGARVYLVAINHIKQYRFEPLPKDSPQVEIWGVISVKSVLQ